MCVNLFAKFIASVIMSEEKMIDFINWCSTNSLPLPTIDESAVRSGVKPQYPEGYARSQYPKGYFPPHSPTSYLDLKNSEKVSSKSPKA